MYSPDINGELGRLNRGCQVTDFEMIGEPLGREDRTIMTFMSLQKDFYVVSTASPAGPQQSLYARAEVIDFGGGNPMAGLSRLAMLHAEASYEELSDLLTRIGIPNPSPESQ